MTVRPPLELSPITYPQFVVDLSLHQRVIELLNQQPPLPQNMPIDPQHPLAQCVKLMLQHLVVQHQALLQMGQQIGDSMKQLYDFNTETTKQLVINNGNMHHVMASLNNVYAWENTALAELKGQYRKALDLEEKCLHLHNMQQKHHASLEQLQAQMQLAHTDLYKACEVIAGLQTQLEAAGQAVTELRGRTSRVEAECEVLKQHVAKAEGIQAEQQQSIEALSNQAMPAAAASEIMAQVQNEHMGMLQQLQERMTERLEAEVETDAAWRENADMVTIALRDQLTEAQEEIEILRASVEGLRQDMAENMPNKERAPTHESSGHRVHFWPTAPGGRVQR